MSKTHNSNNVDALARLLMRIRKGNDPRSLRREASKLISTVGPREIALAEQNLVKSGYTSEQVQQMSTAFLLMAMLDEQTLAVNTKLPANHILRKVVAEHELIRCFLADLEDTTKTILEMKMLSDTSAEFMRLSHIVEHLDSMEEHIEREEDVIFPLLKRYGWESLCRSASNDHMYIRNAVNDMIRLLGTYKKSKLDDFKERLVTITKYLCPMINEHLFREENILYPIALEVIKDNKVWDKIKAVCNEIGYCGVHA